MRLHSCTKAHRENQANRRSLALIAMALVRPVRVSSTFAARAMGDVDASTSGGAGLGIED